MAESSRAPYVAVGVCLGMALSLVIRYRSRQRDKAQWRSFFQRFRGETSQESPEREDYLFRRMDELSETVLKAMTDPEPMTPEAESALLLQLRQARASLWQVPEGDATEEATGLEGGEAR